MTFDGYEIDYVHGKLVSICESKATGSRAVTLIQARRLLHQV